MATPPGPGSLLPTGDIESLLHEARLFAPDPKFTEKAKIHSIEQYRDLYRESVDDPEGFWGRMAGNLAWQERWTKVLAWDPPHAQWFVGGKINASVNCLDRHLATHRWNKTAIRWEGEPGGPLEERLYSYKKLYEETCRLANLLRLIGIKPGDRVGLYLPMIPELVISMLACARIGAVHSVVFGGFSADALRDRLNDAQAKLLITADGGWRKGKIVPLKENADRALEGCPGVSRVLVVRRTEQEVAMKEKRDFWYHEMVADEEPSCEPAVLDSEHPLFILYTSGTTGKPKGVLHTTGGYLVGVNRTMEWVFDIRDDDIFWCTADIGWVTGHSYVVYGPLANGATVVMYEGAPNHPEPDRFWRIIAKYRVNIFYTAPTAIRAFVKWGDPWPRKHDLSSLRLLGSVGEPINPESWMWYHRVIGGGRCPIVDTWWQTETGAILISPLPGATPLKPGSSTRPLPGIDAAIVDKTGKEVPANTGGYLVIRRPWPSMMRTIFGDPERYKKQYWSEVPGVYFAGDGARRDKDGYYWVMGRIDDVIKVSGHRLGTAEVESALVKHATVAEAAVVGRPDDLTGEAIVAFVTLRGGCSPSDHLKEELRGHVAKEIGSLARPAEVRFTEALPKTRSGKIMRRLLRDVSAGRETTGDTTTLEDFSVLAKLRQEED